MNQILADFRDVIVHCLSRILLDTLSSLCVFGYEWMYVGAFFYLKDWHDDKRRLNVRQSSKWLAIPINDRPRFGIQFIYGMKFLFA